ncbi:MAG: ATP-binding cassette domain-containing protein [Chloroflexi bacterium]|nr:MAG: ATP-binding cassette domain-containing protein [Chloroflexota bacterium]
MSMLALLRRLRPASPPLTAPGSRPGNGAADARGPILTCRGVDVAYDKVQVLFGVDFEVGRDEIVALLGTNGAGKSTLLRAIAGLVQPMHGAVHFEDRDITHLDAAQTARLGIVQVPGGKAVFPTVSVGDHFKAAAWLFANEPAATVEARTEAVLDRFPVLRQRWGEMAGNLSGGEQQQLALGMAFIARPRLLIIDELSLGLAPTIVEQLLAMVRAIHAEGCPVILVEQSVNVALTLASRAYFMEKGEVRFSGPTADLLERGDILRSVFLRGASSVAATAPPPAPATAATTIATSNGGSPATSTAAPLLEVDGLSKRFGGVSAVRDVTFTLEPDRILGLIGPNGAGKTTIFDLVSGLLPVDSGRIHLKGVDITGWPGHRRAEFGLARSFQDARIFPSLTVAENLAIGLERHVETRDHLAALLDLPAIQASERNVAYTVEDLIDLLALGAYRDKFVFELSTGTRRIVDLAMAMAHDPDVLLLDEPSSGIAQRETEALAPLLKRLRVETGCAMLVIEHDMPLITSISDEIIALDLGSVVVRGTPSEVTSHPQVITSYLGGDIAIINRSGVTREAANASA